MKLIELFFKTKPSCSGVSIIQHDHHEQHECHDHQDHDGRHFPHGHHDKLKEYFAQYDSILIVMMMRIMKPFGIELI